MLFLFLVKNIKNVYEEIKNKIDLILDSGRSNIGLESTVVDVTNNIANNSSLQERAPVARPNPNK